MCGITVSIALDRSQKRTPPPQEAVEALKTQLDKSLDLLAHRGPDAKGIWINEDASVALAHNRLSINDLTPSATQPHHSPPASGRIHAVVNGEIYDDGDRLRTELAQKHGYVFPSHADTELVLALYSAYGAPAFLDHLRGEFSFVLYDEDKGTVTAARDRFGIKPLFWTVVKGKDGERRVLFAAEAKAFLALGWQPEWDVDSIVQGLWQVGDRTLFKGVYKVLPGSWIEVGTDGEMVQRQYWDLDYRDKREVETRSVEEMVLGVRAQLTEAIRLRLRADVPIGIYLSGGIDSSLLAGIVTHLVREEGIKIGNRDATSRIACFSIEFPNQGGYDESEIAKRTADWLGVQILKKRMDEEALAANFADSVYHCEHHNMNLNSVGKYALSTVPRDNGFKVVLTGEGSDEHFGGYPFFLPDYLREPDLAMPDSILTKDNELRTHLEQRTVTEFKNMLTGPFQGREVGGPEAFHEVNNVSLMGFVQMFHPAPNLYAPWVQEEWASADARVSQTAAMSAEAMQKIREKWHPLHSSHYLWCRSLLANNLLTCLGDRTEMAHSIEARPPFLDHKVSEYVNALPPSVKVAYTPEKQDLERSGGMPWSFDGGKFITDSFSEKWILREAAKPYITQELYERKKQPYMAPSKYPKGGPLQKKFQEICSQEAVERLGFVNYDLVKEALDKAFGDEAHAPSFRLLLSVGSWVTIGERFGVKRAESCDHKR